MIVLDITIPIFLMLGLKLTGSVNASLLNKFEIVATALLARDTISLQHTHEHTHRHTHEHSHDGVAHTHEHDHIHSHTHVHGQDESAHSHDHPDLANHDHIHE